MADSAVTDRKAPEIFGHPTGLFVLFFAEMWERFSYYGMRALLVFYMIKGFLRYDDTRAYGVYAAYTALVYATPFIGGMLADRLLGARRAVILGGVLMCAGHAVMTVQLSTAFYVALALLIVGNGFFKPNISTIVGGLYPKGSSRKDSGFTIFYMGINLGAAMAPLVCGYVGERFGWHYGFGLASVGMLVGLAVFIAPTRVTQLLIGGAALATAASMVALQTGALLLVVNGVVALALVVAAAVAFQALARGPLPPEAGAPPDASRLGRKLGGFLRADVAVYLGALAAVALLALVVRHRDVAGWSLSAFGIVALTALVLEAARSPTVERHRLVVVLVLMFFSMLFWAFFEQAGSSMANFTDRNVDRVRQDHVVTTADVGSTLTLELNQEQLGYAFRGGVFTLDELDAARASGHTVVEWPVTAEHVGMGVGGDEVPASVFQSANPIFILTFGLVFSGLWAFLAARNREPNTPVKFALGIVQLGLGFGALWYGTVVADPRGMVWVGWLLLGYLLHTTGELCLSPVGLSMVTKLSPQRMVSTVMGAWFLALAFSNFLAGVIAGLTGVQHEAGAEKAFPPPSETLHVYGDVFFKIAAAALASGVLLLLLSPWLHRWMHEDDLE